LIFICKPGAVAAVVGVDGGGVVVTIVNVDDDDAGGVVVDGRSVDAIKYHRCSHHYNRMRSKYCQNIVQIVK